MTKSLGHRPCRSVPEFVSARLADGAVAVVITAALLFLIRRLAGAFPVPLEPAAAAAVCIFGLMSLVTCCGQRQTPSLASPTIVLGLIVVALSLSLPGSGTAAITLLWFPAVIGIVGLASGRLASIRLSPTVAIAAPPQAFDASTSSITRRFVDAAGVDCFEATYRAECPADGRFAVVHAAFQPPFAAVPEVEAVLEGQDRAPGVQLRTTLVLPYGARIEVRYASTASAPRIARVRLKARGLQSSDLRNA
ncbi:MAG: hypothetical protein JNK76_17875 [Planctomycetales bacterium]|nr:hypothetical protein [Planctomycetales bacterium]MBN8625856.1 hypothetical protein [Planctomycetota bacterium]